MKPVKRGRNFYLMFKTILRLTAFTGPGSHLFHRGGASCGEHSVPVVQRVVGRPIFARNGDR